MSNTTTCLRSLSPEKNELTQSSVATKPTCHADENTKHRLTALTPVDPSSRQAKINLLTPEGKIEKRAAYKAGKYFNQLNIDLKSPQEALFILRDTILSPEWTLTQGQYFPIVEETKDPTAQGIRRLLYDQPDAPATLNAPESLILCALDFDGVQVKKFDAQEGVEEREAAIDGFVTSLPIPITSDYIWQITASQQLNTNEARLRIWHTFSEPVDLATVTAYVAYQGGDFSYYRNPTMPIYIRPPSFVDKECNPVLDPIPGRLGMIVKGGA